MPLPHSAIVVSRCRSIPHSVTPTSPAFPRRPHCLASIASSRHRLPKPLPPHSATSPSATFFAVAPSSICHPFSRLTSLASVVFRGRCCRQPVTLADAPYSRRPLLPDTTASQYLPSPAASYSTCRCLPPPASVLTVVIRIYCHLLLINPPGMPSYHGCFSCRIVPYEPPLPAASPPPTTAAFTGHRCVPLRPATAAFRRLDIPAPLL